MNKRLFTPLACASLLVLTGCGKKLSQFNSDYFNTNPTPLEVVGDNVPATVTGNIPSKFFVKNAEVTITPVLVYGEQETTSAPYSIQGEKVRGNNQVISYNNGGTITVPVMYAYTPDMMNSNLFLSFNVRQGKKTYVLPRVKVGYGINATATIGSAETVTPAIAEDKFQRIINEKHSADIKFLINQTNIRANQLKSEEMANLKNQVKDAQSVSNREVEGINISSYASPDGGVKLNTRIAEGREKNTQNYLDKTLKQDKIQDFGDLTADFTAQDWEGFKELVSKSNIQDKDLILSVLSMYQDPEIREKEIRNMSTVFDQLAKEILPQLRYSRLTASINVIGKSDEEIMKAFETDPKTLSVDEILYCATLTKDNDKKLQIYNAAADIYPNDYRAINNLGVCQFIDKDFEAAQASFNEAAQMSPQSTEPIMNQGLISLLNKNYADANIKFGSAAGVKELPEALGVYYINIGDYNGAVRAFGDTMSNNAALAQILTKDYSAAKSTLSAIATPDATTYYLMAILGARTNNNDMVYSNLRQAVKLDNKLSDKAKKDIEFSKFQLSNVF